MLNAIDCDECSDVSGEWYDSGIFLPNTIFFLGSISGCY